MCVWACGLKGCSLGDEVMLQGTLQLCSPELGDKAMLQRDVAIMWAGA